MDLRKTIGILIQQTRAEIGILGCFVIFIIAFFLLLLAINAWPTTFIVIGLPTLGYLLGYEVAKNKYVRYLRKQKQEEQDSIPSQ